MPLYAFGSNGSGQLGIGHLEDTSYPTRCLFEDSTRQARNIEEDAKNDGIVRIAAGGNHTVVLFRDGRAYATGCNVDGRCGQDVSKESLDRFVRVAISDPVTGREVWLFKDVSATWEATFLVADMDLGGEDGDGDGDVVFAIGSGVKGELGLGGSEKAELARRVPVPLPRRGARVRSIASGMGHSVVVLENGEVYGWGGARKGQLGNGEEGGVKERKIVWEPVRVQGVPFRAVDVACGREFTVLVGNRDAGEVVVLGSPDNKWGVFADMPASDLLKGCKVVYASWHGVYVHQRDSSVVAWGRNDRGQLPPADLGNPTQLAIGSEHGMGLLDDGTVVAFGWGEHGNCGPDTDAQGNVSRICSRISLALEDRASVVGIGAGCATSWIITS